MQFEAPVATHLFSLFLDRYDVTWSKLAQGHLDIFTPQIGQKIWLPNIWASVCGWKCDDIPFFATFLPVVSTTSKDYANGLFYWHSKTLSDISLKTYMDTLGMFWEEFERGKKSNHSCFWQKLFEGPAMARLSIWHSTDWRKGLWETTSFDKVQLKTGDIM